MEEETEMEKNKEIQNGEQNSKKPEKHKKAK